MAILSDQIVWWRKPFRLAGQWWILIRQPLTGDFYYRIISQFIAVIAVLIAAGNLENPLLEKLKELMFDITGMALVSQRIGHFADQPYPGLNLPEKKKSGIGADLTAIKIRLNFLIRNTFKKEDFS